MKWNRIVLVFICVAFASQWLMCASSKPAPEVASKGKEKQKVDEILDKKKAEQKQKQQDDDDVLKLLGITPEAKSTATAKDSSATGKSEMEQKVSSLESEVSSKDGEISRLKAELSDKDKKLTNLETILQDIKTSPSYTSQASATVGGGSGRQPSSDFKQGYEGAFAEYKRRNYNTAICAYEELLRADATNSYSDNCQYWIGECYYGLEMYQRAIVEFEKVFTFIDSNKEDAAQLKIGLCYVKLNQKDNAKAALERLTMKYPKSEFIGTARNILSTL